MKKVLGCMRRAIQDFNLIENGDKVGVGLSGGKDSMLLLKALKQYQSFSPVAFELEAFTVDLGFEGFDTDTIQRYCNELDVPFNLIKTKIGKIVFDVRNEKSPCSLCAKMRRGAIHNALVEKGFNKLAFAHHADDAIDTLFLSLLYEGSFNTLKPITYLSIKKIYVIRPFLYLNEKDIIKSSKKYNIPTVKNPCYVDKKTKREYVHNLLGEIYKEVPGSRDNLFAAIKKASFEALKNQEWL